MKLKKPITTIVIIFSITLILLALYSFIDYKFVIFGYELKKSGIRSMFEKSEDDLAFSDSVNTKKNDSIKAPPPRVLDTNKQKILLIGDSMVEGLMFPFVDYADFNGHQLFPVIWYSSSSKTFGTSDTLRYYIKKFKPTYIIMALSSNELFVSDIQTRDVYVKRILKQADTLKFVWIGPPNWKKDTGINDLILKFCGKDRYFPSKDLKFDRANDGAHPTRQSSRTWADKIAKWITEESRYPIILNKPDKPSKKTPNATLMTL
jgi:hypothetical protein